MNKSTWKGIAITTISLYLILSTCVGSLLFCGTISYVVSMHRAAQREPDPLDSITAAPAWLGVSYVMTDEGAEISQVYIGSPAEGAGLQVGDIILKVDGKLLTSDYTLHEAIQRHQSGDNVTLTISRYDGEHDITVTLATADH